jgi:hypothetical protein
VRNYKTKETAVTMFVKEHFPNFSWIVDKRIYDGCSKRRPDMFLDLGYQVIIVEIDENQHCEYNTTCENRRVMEISVDVEHRPIIFIRFNPDEYYFFLEKEEEKEEEEEDNEYHTMPSCWYVNGQGLCVVKKTQQNQWNARLQRLKQEIEYWSMPEHRSEKMVEVVQLFFDESVPN